VSGFTSGDGSFIISGNKPTKAAVTSPSILRLRFKLTQHSRDKKLMCSFREYFGCGNYYSQSKRKLGDFIVDKFSDINEKIIPFFKKHKIFGVKSLNFEN